MPVGNHANQRWGCHSSGIEFSGDIGGNTPQKGNDSQKQSDLPGIQRSPAHLTSSSPASAAMPCP